MLGLPNCAISEVDLRPANPDEVLQITACIDSRQTHPVAECVNASTVDVMVLLAVGMRSYVMRRYGPPVVPAIIGLILGPEAKTRLRQSLQISNGDWSILWSTGFSIGVYSVMAALFVWVFVHIVRRPRVGASA